MNRCTQNEIHETQSLKALLHNHHRLLYWRKQRSPSAQHDLRAAQGGVVGLVHQVATMRHGREIGELVAEDLRQSALEVASQVAATVKETKGNGVTGCNLHADAAVGEAVSDRSEQVALHEVASGNKSALITMPLEPLPL